MQSSPSSLFPGNLNDISSINAICIGSGRFLRSVLVPALLGCDLKPAIIQTRGRTFMDYCKERYKNGNVLTYEVDTVEFDGKTTTETVPCYGAGTLGTEEGKNDVCQKLLPNMDYLSVIGVGVTEAGLSSVESKAVQDLADILKTCYDLMTDEENGSSNGGSDGKQRLACINPNGKICVVCTDNIPNSGDVLKGYMIEIAKSSISNDDNNSPPNKKHRASSLSFQEFLEQKVAFLNTMVDRITSQRDGSNGIVPRAEPVPAKALVIEDLHGDLPKAFALEKIRQKYGVVVRTQEGKLSGDIALKLRVANGTHTAVAHLMALTKHLMTDKLSSGSEESDLIMKFLDSFFEHQILLGAQQSFGLEETQAVYADWRKRLVHPHFGLSTFFITQSGAAKGGIRIGPTVRDLIVQDEVCFHNKFFKILTIDIDSCS